MSSDHSSYVSAVVARLWDYAGREFGDQPELLESAEPSPTRPPVFAAGAAEHNLLYPSDALAEVRRAIVDAIPRAERHRHFASMRSSQALAQSVFGSLVALGKVGMLAGLTTDDGLPAFFDDVARSHVQMEYAVGHLGEPRPTQLDVWFKGERRVAVECKFTEPEFNRCSRPTMRPGRDKNYERDQCDGTYTRQRGRRARCSLTEIDVRYWQHLPELFDWPPDRDMSPCPLRGTYQLARNVLAACVRPDGTVDVGGGHALVVYDDRNPAFRTGGEAEQQRSAAIHGLAHAGLLRRCSWQRLAGHIVRASGLSWLVDGLAAKYGIEPCRELGVQSPSSRHGPQAH